MCYLPLSLSFVSHAQRSTTAGEPERRCLCVWAIPRRRRRFYEDTSRRPSVGDEWKDRTQQLLLLQLLRLVVRRSAWWMGAPSCRSQQPHLVASVESVRAPKRYSRELRKSTSRRLVFMQTPALIKPILVQHLEFILAALLPLLKRLCFNRCYLLSLCVCLLAGLRKK